MISYDLDQARSLASPAFEALDAEGGGRQGLDVNLDIASQLAAAGEDLEEVLTRLQSEDPALFEQAIASLQLVMGNNGVNDLLMGMEETRSQAAEAADLLKSAPSGPLPFQAELEEAFGQSLSGIDFKVGDRVNQACAMVDAAALSIGNMVGAAVEPTLELMAHEVTHGLQSRLESVEEIAADLETTIPGDMFEAEAQAVAAQVAAGGRAPQVNAQPGVRGARLARSWLGEAWDSVTSALGFGGGPPDQVQLSIGGARISIPMPGESEEKTRTLSVSGVRVPIDGVELTSCRVTFNDDWEVESGAVGVRVDAGPYLSVNDLTLSVGRGGRVEAQVRGANLNVGGIVQGTIDLTIGGSGISGRAVFGSQDISLPGGLQVTGGELSVSYTNGDVTASGQLTCEVPNLGTIELAAQLNNEDVTGQVSANLSAPVELADGLTILSGSLSGAYSADGWEITGGATFQVRDWVEASFQGTYRFPDGVWSGSGQLDQVAEQTFGSLVLSNTTVGVTFEENALAGVTAGGHFTIPNFEGNVSAEYDVANNLLNGGGSITMTEPMTLGDLTIEEAAGSLTVEDNVLTTMTGAARAKLPFQGEETFDVTLTDGVYQIQEQQLGGTATVTTTRALEFGDPAGLRAEIAEGATGTATLAANAIESFSTGIEFTVHDRAGELGTGNVRFDYGNQRGINGSCTFSLAERYGMPNRTRGPAFLESGSTVTATIANSQMESIELAGAAMVFDNPRGEGSLRAELSGSWDFETGMVTASGGVQITTDWVINNALGTITLTGGEGGGSVTASVEENVLKTVSGQIPFTTELEVGGETVQVSGEIDGAYDAESRTLSGSIEATLDAAVTLTLPSGTVALQPDTTARATIGESEFESLRFDVHGIFTRTAEPTLVVDFTLEDCAYVQNAGFSGTGRGHLAQSCTIQAPWANGDVTLQGGEGGASAEVELANNDLARLEGQIPFTANLTFAQTELAVEGNVDGAYQREGNALTGSIDVGLTDVATIPVSGLSTLELQADTRVRAEITGEGLSEATMDLHAIYRNTANPAMAVDVQLDGATYTSEGVSGTARASLIEPLTMETTWGSGGQASVTLGGEGTSAFEGVLENNKVARLQGELPFTATIPVQGAQEPLAITGSVSGHYQREGEGGASLGGELNATLSSAATIDVVPNISALTINEGSGVKATVSDAMTSFTLNLEGQFRQTGGRIQDALVVDLSIPEATFNASNGQLEARGQVSLAQDCTLSIPWNGAAYANVTLKGGEGGGSMEATIEEGSLKRIDGQIPFGASIQIDDQTVAVTGLLDGHYASDGTSASVGGTLAASLDDDVLLTLGVGGDTFKINQGSSTTVEVQSGGEGGGGNSVEFDMTGQYTRPAAPFTAAQPLKLDVEMNALRLADGEINGSGSVTLAQDARVSAAWGTEILLKEGGTGVTATVSNSEVTQIDGTLNFGAKVRVSLTDVPIDGQINARYRGGDGGGQLAGDLTATLSETVSFQSGVNALAVNQGATLSARASGSTLEEAKLNLTGQYTRTGAPFGEGGLVVDVDLQDVTYSEQNVSGGGTLTLNQPTTLQVGGGEGGQGATVTLNSGSAQVQVIDTALESFEGDLDFDSQMTIAETAVDIHGTIHANYSGGEAPSLGGEATATLNQPVEIGQEATGKVSIHAGSTARATLSQGSFEQLSFTINGDYKHTGAPFMGDETLNVGLTTQNATYTPETGLSGAATLTLNNPAKIAIGEGSHVRLTRGTATARMANNGLESATGQLGFESQMTIAETEVNVSGEINAAYTGGEAPSFSGDFTAQLDQAVELGEVASGKVTINPGATNVRARLDDGAFTEVKFGLDANYEYGGAPFVDGRHLNVNLSVPEATYVPESGLSGTGTLNLEQEAAVRAEGEGGSVEVVLTEGSATAVVESNALTSATGDLKFTSQMMIEETEVNISGDIHAEYTGGDAPSFGGAFNAKLDQPVEIGQLETGKVTINPDATNVHAKVEGGAISEVTFGLDANYENSGAPFAADQHLNVNLSIPEATYTPGSGLSGTATLNLEQPAKVLAGEGENALAITLESGTLQAEVADNALTSAVGDVAFTSQMTIEGTEVNISGDIHAEYIEGSFGGAFNAKLDQPVEIGQLETGQIVINPDATNVHAEVEGGAISEVTFGLDANYKNSGAPFAADQHLDVNLSVPEATYVPGTGISGTATLNLEQPAKVVAGEGENSVELLLESGTLQAEVANNNLTSAVGDVAFSSRMMIEGTEVAISGDLHAEYIEGSFGGAFNAKLDQAVELGDPATGKVTINPDATSVRAKVEDGALSEITFGLDANFERNGAPFAAEQPLNVHLTVPEATYVPGTGISGTGNVDLVGPTTIVLGGEGAQTRVTLNSGSATATVTDNTLTSAEGSLAFTTQMPLGEQEVVVSGDINARYAAEGDSATFGGDFTATLDQAVELGDPATGKVTINPGATTVSATVQDGAFTEVTLGLDANFERNGAPFAAEQPLNVHLTVPQATYTPEAGIGGTGNIDLVGPATIVLGGEGAQTRVTLNSGSATATVTDNTLTSAEGSLAFTTQMPLGEQEVVVSGDINARYAAEGDSATFGGDFTATLDSAVTLGEPTTGQLTVNPGVTTVSATVQDGAFTEVTLGLDADFQRTGAPFTEGGLNAKLNVSDARYTPEDGVSGTGSARLTAPATIQVGENTTVTLQNGAGTAVMENNGLKSFEGQMDFQTIMPLAGQQVSVSGTVNGHYRDEGGTPSFGGDITAWLDNPVSLGEPQTGKFTLNPETMVFAKLEQGAFTEVKLNVNGVFEYTGQPFVEGSGLNAQILITDAGYDETNGISGQAIINLGQPAVIAMSEGSTLTLKSGSVDAAINHNNLESFNGNVEFEAAFPLGEQQAQVSGSIEGHYASEGGGTFGGSLRAQLDSELSFGEPQRGKLTVPGGGETSLRATLADGALEEVTFNLHAIFEREGEPFVAGHGLKADMRITNAGYTAESGISGSATIALAQPAKLMVGDTEVTLTEGSAAAEVSDNELQSLTGQLGFECRMPIAETEAHISGQINATYTGGESASFAGDFTAQLASPLTLRIAGGSITVLTDTNVRASLENGAFTEVKFDLHAHYERAGAPFETPLKLDIQLNDVGYAEGSGFSGSGSISLMEPTSIRVSDDMLVTLKAGSGISAEFENNELTSFNGLVEFESEITVAEATVRIGGGIQAAYTGGGGGESSLTGSIEARLLEDATLNLGSIGTLTLKSDATSLQTELSENGIESIDFNLHAIYARTEAPALTMDLSIANAHYDPQAGFSGTGSAEIIGERVELLALGDYTLFITPGSGAQVTVSENQLQHVGGTITAIITDETEADFMSVSFTGDYDVPNNNFSGNGRAEVLIEKELASIGSGDSLLKLFLMPGSGAQVTVANNTLQSIGGAINLRLDDAESQFATILLQGTFDASGGTGFSGSGNVTVTREKRLAQIDDYAFWLTEGSGANVTITNNELDEVGGNINFKITDGEPEPLIRGQAGGTYRAQEGKFSGSGGVFLGRDVEFDIGGGKKIVFKEGSGGEGEVTDNELRRLGGTLTAELHDEQGALVSITASGEYDAVNNNLIEAEGSAELLRPMHLFDGKVIITELSGRARIENNELVSAGGSCAVEINAVEGATIAGGVDNFLWRKSGDEDLYSGVGWLQVDIGEKISGRLDFELFEDGGFMVRGEVTYTMNEMISGTIGLEMDQEFDPIISGELAVSDVELIPGRDILKFAKNIPMSIPVIPGVNVALGVDFGMKLSMLPLTFDAAIRVENFRPLHMNMPNFECELGLTTGLNFNAGLYPYLGVSIGAPGVEAGLRLKGLAEIDIPIELRPYGILRGGPEGFSGELGIGLNIAPTVTLGVEPQAFAVVPGMEPFEYSFTRWEYQLPELFNFEWSTTYKFGDAGSSQQEGSQSQQDQAPAATGGTTHTEAGGTATSAFEGGGQGGSTPGGPQLESPQDMENKAPGSSESGGGMSEITQKIEEAGQIANEFGSAMSLFSTIMDIIMAGSIAGPVGIAVYLGYRALIKQDLSLESLKTDFQNVLSLAQRLLQYGLDLIQMVLPDWVIEVWNKLQNMNLDEIFQWLRDSVQEAVGATWYNILEPMIDFAQGRAQELVDIFEIFFGEGDASIEELLGAFLRIMGFAATSVVAFAEALVEMGSRVVALIRHCEAEGLIYVRGSYLSWDGPEWRLTIPGIIDESGEGHLVAGAIDLALALI